MALGERAVRRRPPSLEQSGKAEQKTQDDRAENVSAREGLPAHLQPRTNLAAGWLPGGERGGMVQLMALSLFAELIKEFHPIYIYVYILLLFFFNKELGPGPHMASRCSLEPSCSRRRWYGCSGAAWVPAWLG